jgi:hypothetical protein
MSEDARQRWQRPEMTVLARAGSQEAVLTTCKNPQSSFDPGSAFGCPCAGSGAPCQSCASS